MTTDSLYGSKLKIKWAKQHIYEMNAAFAAWVQSNPYTMSSEVDPKDSAWIEVKLKLVKPIPEQVNMLCSYILFDLRSALDYLATALAHLNNVTNISDVYFPIFGSKEKFEHPSCQGKIQKHFSSEVGDLIRSLNPYQGGNDLLYALHALNIVDKHQLAIDVGVNVAFGQIIENSTAYFEIPGPFGFRSLTEDIVLYRHYADAQPNPQIQMPMEITFNHVKVVDKKPVLAVLNYSLNMVEEIVATFGKRFFAS